MSKSILASIGIFSLAIACYGMGKGCPSETATAVRPEKSREQQLLDAIESENQREIERLVGQSIDVNRRTKSGDTFLHKAACHNNPVLIFTLIQAGIPVDAVNNKGYTPLHVASACGKEKAIETLIAQGADVNKSTTEAELTPLHIAINAKNHTLAELLLNKKGTNIDAQTATGRTALHIAIANNDLNGVDLLLNYNPDRTLRDLDGKTPLELAESESPIIVERLEEYAPEQQELRRREIAQQDFFKAIKQNKISTQEQINYFIGQGVDINARDDEGYAPIHRAVKNQNVALATALKNAGAHIEYLDAKGDSALNTAIDLQNDALVALLATEDTVNIRDSKGNNSLHQAILQKNVPALKLVIAAKADVHMPTGNHLTPLQLAEKTGNNEIINLVGEALGIEQALPIAPTKQAPSLEEQKVITTTKAILALIAGDKIKQNLDIIEDQPVAIIKLALDIYPGAAKDILPKIASYPAPNLRVALLEKQEKVRKEEAEREIEQELIALLEGLERTHVAKQKEAPRPEEQRAITTTATPTPNLTYLAEKQERPHEQEQRMPEKPSGYEGESGGLIVVPSKKTELPYKTEFPYQRGQWPAGGPEEPEWQPFALGGTALLSLFLNYFPPRLPYVRNEIALYTKLMAALRQKNYDYAYRLADANRPLVQRLSLDENSEMKKDLEHLIDQKLVNLIEGTSTAARSSNPFIRYLHPPMAKPWKQLTDLLHLIHHPTE